MNATELGLTTDEIAVLRRLVEASLADTRVEVHHTHFSVDLREELKAHEGLLRELLDKLGGARA